VPHCTACAGQHAYTIQPCEVQRHGPCMRRCSTPRAVRWPIAYNLAVTARTLHAAVQPRHRCCAARVETLRDEAERVCHCRRKVRCNAVPTRTRAYKQLVHVHMRTICARKRCLHRRFRCDLRKQTNSLDSPPLRRIPWRRFGGVCTADATDADAVARASWRGTAQLSLHSSLHCSAQRCVRPHAAVLTRGDSQR
jgi:hypothetical protein